MNADPPEAHRELVTFTTSNESLIGAASVERSHTLRDDTGRGEEAKEVRRNTLYILSEFRTLYTQQVRYSAETNPEFTSSNWKTDKGC